MDPRDPQSPDVYKSIAGAAETEIVIEKSRFLSFARPVNSEEAAKDFVAQVREAHREATHVVPAWIIGRDGLYMRCSDDGEPQGTSGIPTLEVLKKQGLTDVAVATVRYFGGTKLGAGGLIRAYSEAAATVIRAAVPVEMVRQQLLVLTVDYGHSNILTHHLEKMGWRFTQRFDAQVHYNLYVPIDLKEPFERYLKNLTQGRGIFAWGDVAYAPRPEDIYSGDWRM